MISGWKQISFSPVIYDTDGNFSGKSPMTAITRNHSIMIDKNSQPVINDGAVTSNARYTNHRYAFMEIFGSDETRTGIKITRQKYTFVRSDGASIKEVSTILSGAPLCPIVNSNYTYIAYPEKMTPAYTKLDFYSMNSGDFVLVGFYTMSPRNAISLNIPYVNSMTALKSSTSSCWDL